MGRVRVFKHGDALAIVFPQSLCSSSELKEGEELEFVEVEKGVFVLLGKEKLAELARQKLEKLEGILEKPFPVSKQSAPFPPPQFPAQKTPAPDSGGLKGFFKRELDSKGFVVVFGESGAKEVSEAMGEAIKAGEVLGTRGFDKRFYVATKEFVEKYAPKIEGVLKSGAASPEQVAEKTKLSEDAAKTVLSLLMEQGEIIEKKKGVFALA